MCRRTPDPDAARRGSVEKAILMLFSPSLPRSDSRLTSKASRTAPAPQESAYRRWPDTTSLVIDTLEQLVWTGRLRQNGNSAQ